MKKLKTALAAMAYTILTVYASSALADIPTNPLHRLFRSDAWIWLAAALILIAVPVLIVVIVRIRRNRK